MKTDGYLKIVLTVIAINLTLLVLQNFDFLPKVNADSKTGQSSLNTVEVPLNSDGSIDVRLKSAEQVPVVVTEVLSDAFDNADVPVEIKDQPIEVEKR